MKEGLLVLEQKGLKLSRRYKMKKYKLSKEMQEDMSVINLAEFLLAKRKKPLLKHQVETIKEEIRRRHKKNLKDAEKWTKDLMDSPIYLLALTQLIRERKATKVIEGKTDKYYADLGSIFETISKIVSSANENKMKDSLLAYCDGFNSNKE